MTSGLERTRQCVAFIGSWIARGSAMVLVKRLIISLLISTGLTVLLFFASGFAGGACHCMTPVTVFFPYGTFMVMRTSWETVGSLTDLFQFSFYGTILAIIDGGRKRFLVFILLTVLHLAAVVLALTSHTWWR